MFHSCGSSSNPVSPQDVADPRHRVLVRAPLDVGPGVDTHRTELEDVDGEAALAHALLAEVDGARAGELHDGGDGRVERGDEEQGERPPNDASKTLLAKRA